MELLRNDEFREQYNASMRALDMPGEDLEWPLNFLSGSGDVGGAVDAAGTLHHNMPTKCALSETLNSTTSVFTRILHSYI